MVLARSCIRRFTIEPSACRRQKEMEKKVGSKPPQCGSRTMPWVPRLWHGMTFSAWLALLRENQFSVTPRRVPLALSVTATTVANSLLAGTQSLFWKRKIEATQLRDDPIFVVGHWRSGTTLLHELLSADPRHTCPDTYSCLAPSHFLVSRYLVPWWLQLLMPKRRPMDNVRVGWKQPQEDEWALCLLGLPTVYRTIAFPRRLPQCPESLTLDQLPADVQGNWDHTLLQFLKSVMVGRDQQRLVLKSPTHTARIGHLAKLFPRARFVHVVRDPLSVFPSTMRLWTRLATDHGLQLPDQDELEQYVLDTFVQMYDAFQLQREQLAPQQICDVHYERLIADPVGQLQRVYEQLELGQFDTARPHFEQLTAAMSGYQVNRYEVPDALRQRVESRWSEFCYRYGYDARGAGRSAA